MNSNDESNNEILAYLTENGIKPYDVLKEFISRGAISEAEVKINAKFLIQKRLKKQNKCDHDFIAASYSDNILLCTYCNYNAYCQQCHWMLSQYGNFDNDRIQIKRKHHCDITIILSTCRTCKRMDCYCNCPCGCTC